MSNMSGIRVSRVIFVFVLMAVAGSAFAQTYNGTCTISSVTASNAPAAFGKYTNSGSMSFNCTGTFFGRITAKLLLQDLNRPVCSPSGGCGYDTFNMKTKDWPVMGQQCVTVGGITQCMPYTVETQPTNATLSSSSTNYVTRSQAVAIVEWITGPCSTLAGVTVCPTTNVKATSAPAPY